MRIRLWRMMQKQRILMEKLGITLHKEERIDIYHDHFLAGCIGLASESLEVLDEINVATRPWANKGASEAQEAVAEEAIDVLFYLLEIFIFLKLDPSDIHRLYEEKWHINMDRAKKRSKRLSSG